MSDDDGVSLPSWITEVDGSVLVSFASSPAKFIRKRVLSFLVGAIASITATIGNTGRDVLGRIAGAFDQAGTGVTSGIAGAGEALVGGVIGINVSVAQAASDVLGPFAPIAIVAFVVLEVLAILRAIPPLLVAASDFLGAVPVLGSVFDAAATFVIEYSGIGGND
jgi:hypothetical protein